MTPPSKASALARESVPELTRDAFLGGALHILQPEKGYRAGVDAVLLAAAVEGAQDRRLKVLDCGAGAGTVGLCIAKRLPSAEVTLLEAEPSYAAIARQNIADNLMEERVATLVGRIGWGETNALIARESYDVVVANPPFHGQHIGTPATHPLKSAAHVMPEDETLETWARFMAHALKPGGEALLIHKADALLGILSSFEKRFGGIRVLPIQPRAGEIAIRILISGIKGSRAPLSVLPGFVLHTQSNTFTPEAAKILREGAALLRR